MDLRTYLNSLDKSAQADFALRIGTSIGYLRKAISIGQRVSPKLAVSIERESAGAVSRIDLFPVDWSSIWPELRPDLWPAASDAATHGAGTGTGTGTGTPAKDPNVPSMTETKQKQA